jgi:release factor glutamine methyltransferase
MNYLETLNYANKLLKLNNVKSYGLDSELLLSKTLNFTREKLLINLNKKIEKRNLIKFTKLVSRRINKEPIAYILKKKEFWRYNFQVNKDVLVPRPETEIIVDEVLKLTNLHSYKKILDIGTGSGCILISIIKERPKFKGTAIDISKKALKVAAGNAKMHQLQNKIKFININIDKFNHNNYDFIVSNPPYINYGDFVRLTDDVRLHEPKQALYGGTQGLDCLKKIIVKSKKLLKINGKLIIEIDSKQLRHSKKILKLNGFYVNKISKDYFGNDRIIISTKL